MVNISLTRSDARTKLNKTNNFSYIAWAYRLPHRLSHHRAMHYPEQKLLADLFEAYSELSLSSIDESRSSLARCFGARDQGRDGGVVSRILLVAALVWLGSVERWSEGGRTGSGYARRRRSSNRGLRITSGNERRAEMVQLKPKEGQFACRPVLIPCRANDDQASSRSRVIIQPIFLF